MTRRKSTKHARAPLAVGSIVVWAGRGLFAVLRDRGATLDLAALEGQPDEREAPAWRVTPVRKPTEQHRRVADILTGAREPLVVKSSR